MKQGPEHRTREKFVPAAGGRQATVPTKESPLTVGAFRKCHRPWAEEALRAVTGS